MQRRSLQSQTQLRQMRKESQQVSLMIYCHCKLFYKPKELLKTTNELKVFKASFTGKN